MGSRAGRQMHTDDCPTGWIKQNNQQVGIISICIHVSEITIFTSSFWAPWCSVIRDSQFQKCCQTQLLQSWVERLPYVHAIFFIHNQWIQTRNRRRNKQENQLVEWDWIGLTYWCLPLSQKNVYNRGSGERSPKMVHFKAMHHPHAYQFSV